MRGNRNGTLDLRGETGTILEHAQSGSVLMISIRKEGCWNAIKAKLINYNLLITREDLRNRLFNRE